MRRRLAAASAAFGRDVDRGLARARGIITDARAAGAALLVLPHAVLGGYLTDLASPEPSELPPALAPDHPALRELSLAAQDMVVCLGYTEAGAGPEAGRRYGAAVALTGDGVLGRHRKVHLPPGEALVTDAGGRLAAFDTPLGRMGLLVDHDKTFPEAARALALDGAELVACPSAWPASTTDRASRLASDRQARLFDLYDCARAAENQVVWVSANQTGSLGGLRFLGRSKVVGPGGEVLARTWAGAGLAVADVDVAEEVARARRVLHHLRERRPEAYGALADGGCGP